MVLTEKEVKKLTKDSIKLSEKISDLEIKIDSQTKNAVKIRARVLSLKEELDCINNKILINNIEKMNLAKHGLILFSFDNDGRFNWEELKIYKIVGLNEETFDGEFEVSSVRKLGGSGFIFTDEDDEEFNAQRLYDLLVFRNTFDSEKEASSALREILNEENPSFLTNLLMEAENEEN